MTKLIEFVERVPPVSTTETNAVVYERFQAEPNTLVIAVLDGDGRPVGLVERNAFFLRMAAEHGRALYGRKPVESLMMRAPLTADGEASAEDFFRTVIAADAEALLKGFIVLDGAAYVGVGTALGVMKAGFALNFKRAEEMTRLAQELAWAEAEATAFAKAKSEFLAVMSHEIRTPLNGVLGLAEIVDKKLTQAELKPYLRTMIGSGETLLRLLNDALDLSRAEAGTRDAFSLDDQPFALASLADDVESLWRVRAEERGLVLNVTMDAAPGLWALGDTVRLKQVLNNLIGNALKFTKAGGVSVELQATLDDIYVVVTGEVSDTGPGIPPDMLETVFEPFATGGDRSGTGAGLGLAICRRIVEAMDGTIGVRSEAGQGAKFSFEVTLFNVPAAAEAIEVESEAAMAPGLDVLVVDDNETNRLVATTLLHMIGCTTETACDGVEALERIHARPFDLILMDIKMPRMDGLEATRLIRTLPTRAAATPIIALTANADPHDEVRYLASGFDAVVCKPIKPDLLLQAMTAVLDDHAAALAA